MDFVAEWINVASETATFSLSEINWGILPSAVVADALLPRHALYYAAFGEAFDGKEAERTGLINFAVASQELEAKALDLATRLMTKSAAVLRATKQAVRNVRTMDVTQAYDYFPREVARDKGVGYARLLQQRSASVSGRQNL
jgi:trans-feruloyl-CoA hydratase/vanillin synthase